MLKEKHCPTCMHFHEPGGKCNVKVNNYFCLCEYFVGTRPERPHNMVEKQTSGTRERNVLYDNLILALAPTVLERGYQCGWGAEEISGEVVKLAHAIMEKIND